MNAIGIDVSKDKSTVAILRPMGEVVQTPIDVPHDAVSPERLACQILSLGENTRVVMEATGRYHEPVAMELHDHGIFVSVVNPLVIHGYCSGGTVRKVKNDRKDSLKIAKFALDHWVDLREYTPMDTIRQQLKIFSRQYFSVHRRIADRHGEAVLGTRIVVIAGFQLVHGFIQLVASGRLRFLEGVNAVILGTGKQIRGEAAVGNGIAA